MIPEKLALKPLDTEDRLCLDTQMIANECTAILGTRGMGKSNTVALLLEQNLPEMPYWSRSSEYLEKSYPDLDQDNLTQRLLNSLPRIR